MAKAHFGMIGLGTMGRNFLLNIAQHGIPGVGFDLDASKRDLLLKEGVGMPVDVGVDLSDFVSKLETPRNIMLLVPAGPIVDKVISDLLPFVEPDDLIIDGGNSHFVDTDRRLTDLAARNVGFMGVGVSGGEEGARHGASIMPGGRRDLYDRIEKTLQAVAAKVNDEPCVAYMGEGSAGHFVKMVHNGIEYGLMQIIAETYDLMRRVLKMDYTEMSATFAEWNGSELNSFLIEITAEVLRKIDADTGQPLVEIVLDKAGQKGTGKWTSQAAMDLGVPVPTIDSAVTMRQISAQKDVRVLVAKKYGSLDVITPPSGEGSKTVSSVRESEKPFDLRESFTTPASAAQNASHPQNVAEAGSPVGEAMTERADKALEGEADDNPEVFLAELKNALLCSFIVTYAQGMSLLQTASVEYKYGLNLADISKIWRGGCIIRSALLEEMRRAFNVNPALPNLLLDDKFAEILHNGREAWRRVVAKFSESSIPAATMSSALAYFDAFRSERLPANLIQAQRDYFGAHTYQRADKDGIFHTPDWESK